MIDGRVVKTSRARIMGTATRHSEVAQAATPSPHSLRARAGSRGPPARIGQYAIERKLGEGGMGVVYAARDERLKRTVALKMMSSLASDERARTRFWREARVAASVNHPNVCQIYEISEDHGELFIAMELLDGEALSERVRKGPLSIADALPIEFGILAALSANLHVSPHRPPRSQATTNVFLTPHNVKLLDFGLARPEPSRRSLSDQPHTGGTVLGAELHGTGASDEVGGRQPMRSLCRRRSCSSCLRVVGRLGAGLSSIFCTPRSTNSLPRSPALPR